MAIPRSGCMVYPYVTLGIASQDLKHELDSVTYTEIGDRNMIREFVSVHGSTEPESTTGSMIAPCSHIPMLLTTVPWVITLS